MRALDLGGRFLEGVILAVTAAAVAGAASAQDAASQGGLDPSLFSIEQCRTIIARYTVLSPDARGRLQPMYAACRKKIALNRLQPTGDSNAARPTPADRPPPARASNPASNVGPN